MSDAVPSRDQVAGLISEGQGEAAAEGVAPMYVLLGMLPGATAPTRRQERCATACAEAVRRHHRGMYSNSRN